MKSSSTLHAFAIHLHELLQSLPGGRVKVAVQMRQVLATIIKNR